MSLVEQPSFVLVTIPSEFQSANYSSTFRAQSETEARSRASTEHGFRFPMAINAQSGVHVRIDCSVLGKYRRQSLPSSWSCSILSVTLNETQALHCRKAFSGAHVTSNTEFRVRISDLMIQGDDFFLSSGASHTWHGTITAKKTA